MIEVLLKFIRRYKFLIFKDWITEEAWDNITELDKLGGFIGISDSFAKDKMGWEGRKCYFKIQTVANKIYFKNGSLKVNQNLRECPPIGVKTSTISRKF